MAITAGVGSATASGSGVNPAVTLAGCVAGRQLVIFLTFSGTVVVNSGAVSTEAAAVELNGSAFASTFTNYKLQVLTHSLLTSDGSKTVTLTMSGSCNWSMTVLEVQGGSTSSLYAGIAIDRDGNTAAASFPDFIPYAGSDTITTTEANQAVVFVNHGILTSACAGFANVPMAEPADGYADAWRLLDAGAAGAKTIDLQIAAHGNWALRAVVLNAAATSDTTPPIITGPSGATGSTSSKSIVENTTAVHTFSANESVTWSLNGGADVALFSINSSTGSLSFLAAPNFEAPADADTNNAYVVGVRATDAASNATTQTLTVTVTDVDETSPNLSAQTATSAAPLTCQGSVTTNEATGTLYVVFTASGTGPTPTQVEAGQDHAGSAALRVVSQAVSATGAQAIASGAVTAGTRFMHAMHKDAAGNRSAVVTTSSFVVAASYTITTDALEDETNAVLAGVTITKVYAVRISDDTLVKTWSAQTTNGSGQLVLSDAALTAVPHAITTIGNSNADAGAKVYTPTV